MEGYIDFSIPEVNDFIKVVEKSIITVVSNHVSKTRSEASIKVQGVDKRLVRKLIDTQSISLDKENLLYIHLEDIKNVNFHNLSTGLQLSILDAAVSSLKSDKIIKKTVALIEVVTSASAWVNENQLYAVLKEQMSKEDLHLSLFVLRIKNAIHSQDTKDIFSKNWLYKTKQKNQTVLKMKEKIEF